MHGLQKIALCCGSVFVLLLFVVVLLFLLLCCCCYVVVAQLLLFCGCSTMEVKVSASKSVTTKRWREKRWIDEVKEE